MAEQTLKEKTSKGLFWGGMSSSVQQLLNVLFGILLARTLSPDDYGLVGVLAVFSILAQIIQDGGFISALINRPAYHHEDYNAVFWFSVIVSLACYIFLFFAAPLIADFFHQPILVKLARWSFVGFVFSGIGIAPRAFLSKYLKIKQMAISNIVAVTLSGLIGVFLALHGFQYWALVVQSLVLVGVTNFGYCLFSEWKPSFSITISPVREMFGFALPLFITGVFSVANSQLMTVILGRRYSPEQTGYYSQANKWALMGSNVMNGMVNTLAQPVLSEVVDEGERHLRVFRKLIRFTSFVSFPALLGLGLIVPEFIILALSSKWTDSILMLQILCVSGSFIPLTTICSQLVLSKGKSYTFMWVQIMLFIFVLAAAFLLYPFGILAMLIGVSTINVIWLFVWVFFVNRETGYTFRGFLSDILPYFMISVFVMASTFFMTQGFDNLAIRLVMKVLIAFFLYVFVMWATKSVIFKESIQFIIKKH